jgi:hypothetical protein
MTTLLYQTKFKSGHERKTFCVFAKLQNFSFCIFGLKECLPPMPPFSHW